jgi:hypothetical protein
VRRAQLLEDAFRGLAAAGANIKARLQVRVCCACYAILKRMHGLAAISTAALQQEAPPSADAMHFF